MLHDSQGHLVHQVSPPAVGESQILGSFEFNKWLSNQDDRSLRTVVPGPAVLEPCSAHHQRLHISWKLHCLLSSHHCQSLTKSLHFRQGSPSQEVHLLQVLAGKKKASLSAVHAGPSGRAPSIQTLSAMHWTSAHGQSLCHPCSLVNRPLNQEPS